MKTIPIEYLAGLTKEQQAEIKRIWKLDSPLMNAFRKVVEKRIVELTSVTNKDYDRPGWAYWRAARDGQLEALQNILELIPDRG